MRTLTRKLLSLLLVFTMVCAMVPAAMAAGETPEEPETETETPTEPGTDDPENTCDHKNNNFEYTPNNNGTHKVVCKDCGGIVDDDEACTAGTEWKFDNTSHWHECSKCRAEMSKKDHTATSDTPTDTKDGCQ